MTYFASTLGQLQDAINSFVDKFGRQCGVGVEHLGSLDMIIQIELVYIDKSTGEIVGDEAEDYKPISPNEVKAVKIS